MVFTRRILIFIKKRFKTSLCKLYIYMSSNAEEMFVTNNPPTRVVYWGISKETGWAERVEFNI